MSSIAYVTDEQMVEYHRLCGNREMNFWRLSSKRGFSAFHKGDLLFFYTRNDYLKDRAFLGYAHFESTSQLTTKQMWKRYGTANGYDSLEQMEDAIRKASRDHHIPEKLNCLYLVDAVFFRQPVLPKDIGIHINRKLESYCYLDQEDPQVTIRILKEAEKAGIDLWASQAFDVEDVFRDDEIRHQLALFRKEIGNDGRSAHEETVARRLARMKTADQGWEMIRGSETDCFKLDKEEMTIAIPFVYRKHDRDIRLKEWMGTIAMYRIKIDSNQLPVKTVRFEMLSESDEAELKPLLKVFNYE